MQIIFLDIDGVLATSRSYRSARSVAWGPFDLAAIANFKILLELTKAGVVISSAWRTDSSLDMGKVLKRVGVRCDIVGQTPVLGGRGYEIAAWLAAHPRVIDRFVILDDTRDPILCRQFGANLVPTTMELGFDSRALHRALTILMGQKVSLADPVQAVGFKTLDWGKR